MGDFFEENTLVAYLQAQQEGNSKAQIINVLHQRPYNAHKLAERLNQYYEQSDII